MEEVNRQIGKIQKRVREFSSGFAPEDLSYEQAIIIVENEKISGANQEALNFFGFADSDLVHVSLFILFPEHQQDGTPSREKIIRIIENLKYGETIDENIQLRHKKGSLINSRITFRKSLLKGEVFLIIPVARTKKRAPSYLSETGEHLFYELSGEVPILLRMSNDKNECYYFNKHWQKFTGKSLKEEKDGKWQSNILKDDRDRVQNTLNQAFQNLSKYELTYRLIRHDGIIRSVFESGIPLFDSDGLFLGFLSVTVDISKIREVELTWKESQEKLQLFTENAPVLFRMSDEHSKFYYFSKQWLAFTGRTLKEELDNGWLAGVHKEDYKAVVKTLEEAFSTKRKYEIVFRIKDSTGEYKWVMDSGMPVFTHMGEYNGFISAVVDIHEQKQLEEEKNRQWVHHESEKKLQSSLNSSNLIALTIDAKERIIYCNKCFLDLTGYDPETVTGKDVNQFVNAGIRGGKSGKRLGDFIWAKGYPESFDAIILNEKKEKVFVKFSAVVLHGESGLPANTTIIGEDTTEKRRVQEELEKTNTQLSDLFDNANDLIQVFKPDGKVLLTNRTWREKLGYKEEEIEKLKLKDIIHPEVYNKTLEYLDEIAKSKQPKKFDTVFVTKDGTSLSLTGSVNCSFRRGQVKEFRGIFYDITERIRSEKAKNLFHSISNLAIHSLDLDQLFKNIHAELGKIINVDNFYIALYDQDQKYLKFPYYIDKHISINPETSGRPFGRGITEHAITKNRAFVFYEKDFYRLNGKGIIDLMGEVPKIWIGVPLRLNHRIIGVIAAQSYENPKVYSRQDLELLEFISGQVALSIDRKQKEEKIREQAGRLQAIFESTRHIIWSVNREYKLTSYNSNYAEFLKKSLDEESFFKNKKIPRDLNEINKLYFWTSKYKKAFTGEIVHFEKKFIRVADNSESWYSIVLNPIYDDQGRIAEISGIANDITENKKSEIALQESEEKFRKIFESFQDVYFRCDFKGEILLLSPSVKEVLGYEPEALIGKDITNFYLYSKKTQDLIKQMIRRRSVRDFEASVIDKDGNILQCICNVRLIYDNTAKKAAMEGVVRDITKLKQANIDLKQAKDIAERSLKVKELFLANMSHEIRTPMNGIIGMIDLLEGTSVTEEQKKYIGTIKKSSATLLNILNDILDLSKIEAGKMQLRKSPVKLKNILEKLYALFTQQALTKNINLYYHLSEDLPEYLMVDETRLLQILSNLVSNAIKFTDGGGSINIGMKKANIPGKKHMIKCVVSDSGIGISHENVKKLFTSFSQLDNSTTKTFGGTGLGLAISKELCKLMGGKIGVFSTLGLGSTFWFTFLAEPTQKTVVIENRIVDQDIRIEGYFKDESPEILLVDDNIVNRQVAGEILKKSGCKVELADCGSRAIEMVKVNNFDLIFMDIQMPEMDGVTATHKIKELGKSVPPVVAMTAYSMKEDRERFLKQGLDDYISKPIKANDLLNKVRQWVKDEFIEADTEVVHKLNQGEVLNDAVFTQLESLSGVELLRQIYNEFIEESKIQIKNCTHFLSKKDYQAILKELHTLKGNAGTLGAEKLSKQAEFIEANLKDKKYDTTVQDIEFLKLTFNEFQNRYNQKIKGKKS